MISKKKIPDIVASEMVFRLGGKITKEQARSAIAYALNAWPGMTREGVVMARIMPRIVLPLSQEESDEPV